MKNILTIVVMLISITISAQVGINNTSPKATLDITAKTTDGSKPEGLIIPKLSGDNIRTATATAVYGAAQKGLIVYASSADTNPTGATANITAEGYYYFDGGVWQKIITGKVANADLSTGVGGIYKGSGSLSGNTTVTQGASTLAFTSTATNGFSVDGATLSVDAANNRVGMGTSGPLAPLHISATTTGDHLRMTNSASDWALSSENAGAQNGISGQPSFTIVNRLNNYRIMTIGAEGSFRLGGGISVGTSALSIDGPTNKVGIGINVPNATLDVKAASNGSTPEGIIAPRLSLTALQGYTYGTNQTGAIVYVNSASGTPAGQTANVTAAGYYYFDGSTWQKIMAGTVANADLSTGVGGIYKGSGSLAGNTTVAQNANTLDFTSTATTGTSHFTVDGSTFSVDAVNNRVGIRTVVTTPKTNLHVSSPAGQTTPIAAFSIVNCGATCAQGNSRNIVLNNIQTNNNFFASIDFVPGGDPTDPSGSSIQGIDRDATNNYAGLSFFTRNATDYNSRMVIKSSGNVGIGTNTPATTLTVNGIISSGVQSISTAGIVVNRTVVSTTTDFVLPSAVTNPGAIIFTRNINTTGSITVTTSGGSMFNGGTAVAATSYTMNATDQTKTILWISDGANWTAMTSNF